MEPMGTEHENCSVFYTCLQALQLLSALGHQALQQRPGTTER